MDIPNYELVEELSTLKGSVHTERQSALSRRLARNPFANDLEYLLGAFLEMYEPHLYDVVLKLSQKGYIADVSSGFSGKFCESQSLNGYLHPDYITKNKLEKIGIKFRDFQGLMSLTFWPSSADLEEIKTKWIEIIQILPDKGMLDFPSQQADAVAFRMKYVPKDKILQRKRLFERLLYAVQKETDQELEKRKIKNSYPDKTELCLGTFVEELETQARAAVLLLNKKGYSIDASGFMQDPCQQMVEGDFQLGSEIVEQLKKIGAAVETNPSGYTRIQFTPLAADIKGIKKQWLHIAQVCPKRREPAAPSMTKKARDFRLQYAN